MASNYNYPSVIEGATRLTSQQQIDDSTREKFGIERKFVLCSVGG